MSIKNENLKWFSDMEKIIDSEGLVAILNSLGTICYEKADHIKTTYPNDKELCRQWERVGSKIYIASDESKHL
jgi:hypothetical protein